MLFKGPKGGEAGGETHSSWPPPRATCQHQHGPDGEEDEADQGNDAPEEDFELLRVQLAPEVVYEGVDLTQAEDSKGSHVLRGEDGLRAGESVSRCRKQEPRCARYFCFSQITSQQNRCPSHRKPSPPRCPESLSYIGFDSQIGIHVEN